MHTDFWWKLLERGGDLLENGHLEDQEYWWMGLVQHNI
jgi:hypothetical protein